MMQHLRRSLSARKITAATKNAAQNQWQQWRSPRCKDLLRREFTAAPKSTSPGKRPSFGFSGAGFLGCYHVGAAACLNRHGWFQHPNDDGYNADKMPLLTGVSAGSMIAAATLAGVNPEPDGMEVVLEAARRTRQLSEKGASLDVLTPGFSLIDQVEGPFRDALAKALGGYCEKDDSNNYTFHDIDPVLFARRFPEGSLRIGLTDRRDLWPPPTPFSDRLSNAYRYVDTYRNLEDVIACSMLSSYIPGGTGPVNLTALVKSGMGIVNTESGSEEIPIGVDTSGRAGLQLNEMTQLGMVKHGKTGLPINTTQPGNEEDEDDADKSTNHTPTYYWDGGIADVFPTFDSTTVIVTPLNGLFGPNPSISPEIPDEKSYFPATFHHCPKSELGLNSMNALTAFKMMFSSDDDELYSRFKEGYDDARKFLDERGQLSVFSG